MNDLGSCSTMLEREHLHRLRKVWTRNPVYFLTTCAASRRRILATPAVAVILVEAWRDAWKAYGWSIGRYVVMPDHVHFFAAGHTEAKTLNVFMRDWKRWTARKIVESSQIASPVWQAEFFDHLLRSVRSYSQKWEYIRQNPVRAGLAASPEAWPYAGELNLL